MKNAKKLNEQMIRIKSLFTEERLWGNIINEACESEQEAADYLENKGYVVAPPGSSGAKTQRSKLLACLNDPGNEIINKANDEVSNISNRTRIKVEITDDPVCALMLTPKVFVRNGIRVTIKVDGTLYVYWQNQHAVTLGTSIIKYVGYKGTTDGINYSELVYDRCYLSNGSPITGTNTPAWERKIFQSSNAAPPCRYGGPQAENFLYRLTGIDKTGTIKGLGGEVSGNYDISDGCMV